MATTYGSSLALAHDRDAIATPQRNDVVDVHFGLRLDSGSVHFGMSRIDASMLRRNLFDVLKHLEQPIEIARNGRTAAILSPPKRLAQPAFDPRRLARICTRHGIDKLAIFGSLARGIDFGAESDVDVLVTSAPSARKTYDRHMDIVFALEDLFGRSVDLCYAESLAEDRDVRDMIEADMKVLYEA